MTRTIWSKFIATILALAMAFALMPARPALAAADIEETTTPGTSLRLEIPDIFDDPTYSFACMYGFTQPTSGSAQGHLYLNGGSESYLR